MSNIVSSAVGLQIYGFTVILLLLLHQNSQRIRYQTR